MTKTDNYKLSDFYNEHHFAGRVDFTRFWLMAFVFLNLFGFPISITVDAYVKSFSSFAALSFFIFYGFFRLVPNPEMRMIKLKRALKSSWKFFLIMLAAYFALNVAYMAYLGELRTLFSAEYFSPRRIFNFLIFSSGTG